METAFEHAALCGAGSSGAHQQVLGTVHGGGGSPPEGVTPVIESNFRDGVYKIDDVAVTLGDIWVDGSATWGPLGDFTITPGLGYVKQDGGAPEYAASDEGAPILAGGLIGTGLSLDLADGFTVLFEGSIVYASHEDAENACFQDSSFGFALFDTPDFMMQWSVTAGPSISIGDPGTSSHKATFRDNDGADFTDSISPAPASPMVVRLAATVEENRVAFSLNGRTAQVFVPTNPAVADVNGLALLFILHTGLFETTSALEYVAFYPKFANDADLMTLTAPAD